MSEYLQRFNERLRQKYGGSLVRVETVRRMESNAKEYLNKLAKAGLIERVKWGWYWIPDHVKDFWEFLERDRNFKVVSGQTAASLWNYDFIHRNAYFLRVKDRSFAKALEAFGKRKGWNIRAEYAPYVKYTRIGNLSVEDMESTVIDCLQNWAFTDALATLYSNREKIRLKDLPKRTYWKRVSGTNIRVRQVLEYALSRANELAGEKLFPVKEGKVEDEYLKRELDEAVEKVVELG